jgi:hypothetical protein
MLVLQIAGGIVLAAAIIGLVASLFRDPRGTFDVMKGVGALACAAGLLYIVFVG